MTTLNVKLRGALIASTLATVALSPAAYAVIDGVKATTFNLTAKADYISLADGGSMLAWGYANGAGTMQYPGVTMIVNQGDAVTINLKNELPVPVSMVFPGQENVVATGGSPGLVTREVPADNGATQVTYKFTATHPGTYLYYSGTQSDLQTEMGLVGAIIVRPPNAKRAYDQPDAAFDREYLFLLTEADQAIHDKVAAAATPAQITNIDMSRYHPVLWFINGRNGPDTMADANVGWLPTQPYNSLPRMHPGEKVLMRIINAGHDLHPFHHHGNNAWLIGQDGRVLANGGNDLAVSNFTVRTVPGETYDAIFEWTGAGLGWDMYGHKASDPLQPNEPAADHGKPFPVKLPSTLDMTIGAHYSGSPYLGTFGVLPPGQGGFNPTAGYFFMWHSHTERELTNNDIFPGGMMTMLIVEPWSVTIP